MRSTEHLADLIYRKLEVIEQIYQLALRQNELAAEGGMAQVMQLLSLKQTMIGQMQHLEKELSPYRDDDPEQRQWASPERRAECAAWAGRCETLLAAILQLEQESEQKMVRRRDQTAAQISGAHTAAEATHAYTTPHQRSGQGIDLSSAD